MKIKNKLNISLISTLTLFILIFLFVILLIVRTNIIKTKEKELLEHAKLFKHTIDSFIYQETEKVKVMSLSMDIKNQIKNDKIRTQEGGSNKKDDLNIKYYEGVVVLDVNGRLIKSFSENIDSDFIKILDFDKIKNNVYKDPVIKVNPKTGNPLFLISSPVKDRNSNTIAIMIVALKIVEFGNDYITRFKIEKNGYAYLLSDQMDLIAHPKLDRILKKSQFTREDLINKTNKIIKYIHKSDNKKKFLVSKRLDSVPWFLNLTVYQKDFLAILNVITISLIITFIVMLILIFVIIYIISIFIIDRPIATLTQTISKVASGDLTTDMKLPSKDEVGDISKQLDFLVKHLKNIFSKIKTVGAHSNTVSEYISEHSKTLVHVIDKASIKLEKIETNSKEIKESLDDINTSLKGIVKSGKDLSKAANENYENVRDLLVQVDQFRT